MKRFSDLISSLLLIEKKGAILVVDEADQVSGREYSDTDKRLFEEIRTFLSDDDLRVRGKVLAISGTDISGFIDSAMLREGRMSLQVAFFEPPKETFLEIFKAITRMKKVLFSKDVDLEKIIEKLKPECTGSHVNEIISRAYEYARKAGESEIKQEDLERAIDR